MLGDGGLGNCELLSHERDYLSRSVSIPCEDLQDAPADRIAESLEGVHQSPA